MKTSFGEVSAPLIAFTVFLAPTWLVAEDVISGHDASSVCQEIDVHIKHKTAHRIGILIAPVMDDAKAADSQNILVYDGRQMVHAEYSADVPREIELHTDDVHDGGVAVSVDAVVGTVFAHCPPEYVTTNTNQR